MPNNRRTDDRVRLLTIAPGWPARTVAALLEAAADATLDAISCQEELTPDPGTYARRDRDRRATALVEARSDGIAVYAHTDTRRRA